MRAEPGSRKKIRTGVAISPTEICAADIRLRGRRPSWRAPLEPPPSDARELAVARLGARRSGAHARRHRRNARDFAHAAAHRSAPPRVSAAGATTICSAVGARRVALLRQRARAADRRRVVAATRRVRGSPAPVVAAAASARLIAAIRSAAEQAGWTVESISPAEARGRRAALALWPAFARAAFVCAHRARRSHGLPRDRRRVARRRSTLPRRIGRCGDDRRHGWTDGAHRHRRRGRSAPPRVVGRARAGMASLSPSRAASGPAPRKRGDVLAAQFAGSEVGPTLRTEGAIALERADARESRRGSRPARRPRCSSSPASVAVGSASPARSRSRRARADSSRRSSSTLVGRTTVDATYRHLATLGGAERAAPHWSSVIAKLERSPCPTKRI